MSLSVTGSIKQLLELQTGTSAAGKDWKKQSFLLETTEEFNNLYCLELFGEEKVDNFLKFNKVGDAVKVDFNVQTNEWKGKYFTSLQAWKVFKAESETHNATPIASAEAFNDNDTDNLPF